MKRLLSYIMIAWVFVVMFGSSYICNWQRHSLWWTQLSPDMTYQDSDYISTVYGDTTNLWDHVSIKEKDKTIIVRLLWVFWLDTDNNRDHKFLDYARAIINLALWLVAFIALIMSLYTFYMMFFSENEAGIKKAKWNLIGIFIALGILGLAWLIVSFIFRWYQSNWQNNEILDDSSPTYLYVDDDNPTYLYVDNDGNPTYFYY